MLNINVEYRKGILFLRLYGILNQKTSTNLDNVLDNLINNVGIKYLLLNCNELLFINDSGINVIRKRCNEMTKRGGECFICGCDNKISNMVETSTFPSIQKMKDEVSVFNIVNI